MIVDIPTHLLRPLPRPVKIVHNETLSSYLRRLAEANRLDQEALRAYAAGDTRKSAPVPLVRISILSGQNTSALRHGIPDLCTVAEQQKMHVRGRPGEHALVRAACTFCTATSGVTGFVRCYLRDEDVVCLRHQRWISDHAASGAHQLHLDGHPEIIEANMLHRRLIRSYSRRMTHAAYREAKRIVTQWHSNNEHDLGFLGRMEIFHHGSWRLARTDPTIEASTYPQIVALARLLASPDWRERPFRSEASLTEFIEEMRRTVSSHYQWDTSARYGRRDPLVELILAEARYRTTPDPEMYRAPSFALLPVSRRQRRAKQTN